jgi:TolB protein
VIKCNVCGSENEAAALFCGTCGSPLSPAEATAIAEEATRPEPTPATPDDTVVPGQNLGARRDLGIGTDQAKATPLPTGTAGTDTGVVDDDVSSGRPTVVCSVCGTVNDATRTYCRKCANELKPAPPPPPPLAPAPLRRQISPVAIGLGAAAVVVAIALIGVLAFGGGPVATLQPTARATTVPTAAVVATAGPTVVPSPSAGAFTEGARSGLIAFARCPAGGACTIYVMNANGTGKAKAITAPSSGSAQDPGLSHDRKRIVYTVSAGLRIVTVATGSWVQQSAGPGDTSGAWSPDDKRIAFAGHRAKDPGVDTDLEIRLENPGGGSATVLTNNDVTDHDPSWSPDGKSIVYVQGDGNQRELELIDIASGKVTALTNDAFNDVDPAVSPDGTQIVFASTRGNGTEFDLFLMNLATQAITPLPTMPGDEHDPSWSPGGRYIVFSAGPSTNKDLYILDLSTNKIIHFTTGAGSDLSPSWQ